jgi:hypothetical protein
MKHLWIGFLIVLGAASPALGINVYNVSDYASAQAAIDAAEAAGGGLVHFPCGTTASSRISGCGEAPPREAVAS